VSISSTIEREKERAEELQKALTLDPDAKRNHELKMAMRHLLKKKPGQNKTKIKNFKRRFPELKSRYQGAGVLPVCRLPNG